MFRPRYDDLSNIQSGKDNQSGLRMVEFPLYQIAGVYIYKLFPKLTIEETLRIISIAGTCGSILLVGLLLFDLENPFTGIVGMFLYAVLPFSIYYGRAILPDPTATFFALLSLYLLVVSQYKRKHFLLTSCAAVSAAISLLVRPMAIFLLFPSPFLIIRQSKFSFHSFIRLFVYLFISLLPLILWRLWIQRYPEGIPASVWLLNYNGIRFKGAWFYWLFAKRIGELILGYWGLIPFSLGIIISRKKMYSLFSYCWLIGALMYLIIFAGGNVQHDYYHVLLIPVIIWFTAEGVAFLFEHHTGIYRPISVILAVISLLFTWAFSWYTVRTYFWINRPEIVEAGKAADRILPNDARVIAPYNGDTTFLYQTKRQGWPLGFDIEKKLAMGATTYVTVSPTDSDLETRDLARRFTVLVRNDKYAIIDLTKSK